MRPVYMILSVGLSIASNHLEGQTFVVSLAIAAGAIDPVWKDRESVCYQYVGRIDPDLYILHTEGYSPSNRVRRFVPVLCAAIDELIVIP